MPPRKRQRDDKDPPVDNKLDPPSSVSATHNPDYYYDHADCIILVENTLFKACLFKPPLVDGFEFVSQIHKFMLSRDSSVFRDMFALPGGDNSLQGSSDEMPIVLQDKVADFHSLCWLIYSL